MASLTQENFTFSNPSQISTTYLPEQDLNSWSAKTDANSKNREIEGNKVDFMLLNSSRFVKDDPHELSFRDIVVEFPTISSYMKESYAQGTQNGDKIKLKRNNTSKSKSGWSLLKILFPLPSKVEKTNKSGIIGNDYSVPKLSLENTVRNVGDSFNDDFDLWEDNIFSDTSLSSRSSSSSNSIRSNSDHDRRDMNGCFPFFNTCKTCEIVEGK